MQHCRSLQRSQGSLGGWNGAVQATSTLASGRRGYHHCRAKAHGCGTLRILVEEQARPCQLLPPAGCHHPRSPWMRDVQTPFGALASVSEASQRRVHVGCRLRSGPALMPTTLCHVIEHWNVRQHHGCRPKGEHQTCCQQRLSCKALTPGHAPVVYELLHGKHGGYLCFTGHSQGTFRPRVVGMCTKLVHWVTADCTAPTNQSTGHCNAPGPRQRASANGGGCGTQYHTVLSQGTDANAASPRSRYQIPPGISTATTALSP